MGAPIHPRRCEAIEMDRRRSPAINHGATDRAAASIDPVKRTGTGQSPLLRLLRGRALESSTTRLELCFRHTARGFAMLPTWALGRPSTGFHELGLSGGTLPRCHPQRCRRPGAVTQNSDFFGRGFEGSRRGKEKSRSMASNASNARSGKELDRRWSNSRTPPGAGPIQELANSRTGNHRGDHACL